MSLRGTLSPLLSLCALLPKSACNGLTSPKRTLLGSLLMPRRDPTAPVALAFDLTMLAQSAFRVRKLMLPNPKVLLPKILTNLVLTTPCPPLGLDMFLSPFRKCPVVLIPTTPMLRFPFKVLTIRRVLPPSKRLRLMKTYASRLLTVPPSNVVAMSELMLFERLRTIPPLLILLPTPLIRTPTKLLTA